MTKDDLPPLDCNVKLQEHEAGNLTTLMQFHNTVATLFQKKH